MNLTKTLGILVAVAALGTGYGKPVVTAPAHLTSADSLAMKLRSQGENGEFTDASGKPLNQYGAAYKDVVMVWGPTAKVNAVCANFVTKLLELNYPGWTAKGAGFGTNSPNPAMYHDAIEANSYGFTKVEDFANIMPGDFLMSEYYDDHENVGHAMIVSNAAVLDEDEDTGIVTWAVEVIDCSKNYHSNDTREFTLANGTIKITQGAGKGTIRVLTLDGEIVGYSWSFRNGSVIYTPDVRHLTLGRLQ